jgi:hypothetical protein
MLLLMKSIAIGSNLAISPLFTKRAVPCSLLSYLRFYLKALINTSIPIFSKILATIDSSDPSMDAADMPSTYLRNILQNFVL